MSWRFKKGFPKMFFKEVHSDVAGCSSVSNSQDPHSIADCAHGVHDKIQYHLLDQDPINNYRRKVPRHFRAQGYTVFAEIHPPIGQ
jgi:hypothetical protein